MSLTRRNVLAEGRVEGGLVSVLPTSNRLPREEPRCQELEAIGSGGLAVGKNWDAPLLQPELVHSRKVRLNDGQV